MTHQPEDRTPDEPLPEGSESPADEDAAWAAIVAHYGDRPSLHEDPPAPETAQAVAPRTPPAGLFDRGYLDSQRVPAGGEALEAGDGPPTWDDEGHYVPPPPPPLPVVDPRRRVAWAGLVGGPLLMLLGIVVGWTLPGWVLGLATAGFVLGFLYLVATMPRRGADWSGDDGAVV